MKCSMCKVNEAGVPIQHVVNGVSKQLNICEACAKKHGFHVQLPIPLLTDFLFGVGGQAESSKGEDNACTACHMHRSDFHKSSLLGCPACYTSFEGDIALLLENMHRGERHEGKVPRKRLDGYLAALRARIETLDRAEEYRQSEALRVRLRQLEQAVSAKRPDETNVDLDEASVDD